MWCLSINITYQCLDPVLWFHAHGAKPWSYAINKISHNVTVLFL